jgi:hypothetical protein
MKLFDKAKLSLVFVFCVGDLAFAQISPSQTPPLKTISAADYLKLPPDFQAMYLAGVLDGISFKLYGESSPEYSAWASCARKTTLADFVKELVTFLEKNPEEKNYPLPWPASRVLGARRPCN